MKTITKHIAAYILKYMNIKDMNILSM